MNKTNIKQFVEITFGIISLAIAFYFFFLPLNLVTGGVTGLSIVFQQFISPSIFILIANGILLFVGLAFLGKKVFVRTIYGTLLLPILTFILENTCESDYFLSQIETSETSTLIISVICGGILAALGLGLCFRNNATTGGMDIIQKIISKYFKVPYSKAVYATDGVVVLMAFFVFQFERTFYAVICIILIGYLVDIISMGGKTKRTAYIITKNPDEIKQLIYKELERGVTECDVRGGYSKDDYVMLICTLEKNDSYRLRGLILTVDEHAFTFFASTKEVLGEGF